MKQPKLIDNYIYFYHLEEYCLLPMYPDSITENLKTSFGEVNALSRSAPVFTYQNSGPRTVTIDLDLHRDLFNDLNASGSFVSNLMKPEIKYYARDNGTNLDTGDTIAVANDYTDTLIKYLQAASLPKYNVYNTNQKSVTPPMVAIRFGNDIFIKGVINSGINVTYEKPILSNNKYAKVKISFSIAEYEAFDAETVKQLGSFRSVTSTNPIYESDTTNTNVTTVNNSTITYENGEYELYDEQPFERLKQDYERLV